MTKTVCAFGVLGLLVLGCSAAPPDSPVGTVQSAVSGNTCAAYSPDGFWDGYNKAAETDWIFEQEGIEAPGGTVVQDVLNFAYAYCGGPPHFITYQVNHPNGTHTFRFGITMAACNGSNNQLGRLYAEGYLAKYPWAHGGTLATDLTVLNWVYPFLQIQQYQYTACGNLSTYMAIDIDPLKLDR